MIWLSIVTGSIYLFAIAIFFCGWEKLKEFNPVGAEQVTLSVIVAMRNEEEDIANLLNDLVNQEYPSDFYEVIVVDDHSCDQSHQIASGFIAKNISVYRLPELVTGKKAALNYGITMAQGQYIITTDADCRVGERWISYFALYFERLHPVMILGPVISLQDDGTVSAKHALGRLGGFLTLAFKKMQSLEFFSLLGSTAGACAIGHPVMSNGANLAFSMAIYPEIQDLYDKGNTPSGDDIFVMLRLKKKFPGKVHFLKSKESVVFTKLPAKLSSFFSQRSRWAGKFKFYNDPVIIATALIVFATNFLLVLSLIYGLVHHDLSSFFLLIFMKSSIDFFFLYRVASFFDKKRLMFWFPFAQSLYFIYVCTTVFLSLILPNHWKGRRM